MRMALRNAIQRYKLLARATVRHSLRFFLLSYPLRCGRKRKREGCSRTRFVCQWARTSHQSVVTS